MVLPGIKTRKGLLLLKSPDSPAERTAEKRRIRKHQVLDAIRRYGPIARVEIARKLGFNLPTVSNLVDELVREGLAIESEPRRTAIGRRPIPVYLNPHAACVLGVDLGKIVTIGLIMNLGGTILGRVEKSTPTFSSASEQGRWVQEFVREFLREHAETLPPLAGVGVALPGFIYRPERAERHLTPEVEEIQRRLEEDLDVPIIVDNDAQMMALGALWFGNASNYRTFCILNIGYGIGMGTVIDRAVYQGFFGHAGEIGHIPFGQAGYPCYCGGHSCLENTASGSGVERMARETELWPSDKIFSAFDIADLARKGDQTAVAIWNRFATALARAIGTVITLFNPQAVILAGRYTKCSDVFFDRMMEELKATTFPALLNETDIVVSDLKENAGPLGTCACVLHHIFSASHIPAVAVV
jgi:predicted NBD/HSP70 family sugar kinase